MDYDDWENNVRELEEEMQSKHDEEQTIGSLINGTQDATIKGRIITFPNLFAAMEKKREEAEKETEAKQLALDDLKVSRKTEVRRQSEVSFTSFDFCRKSKTSA